VREELLKLSKSIRRAQDASLVSGGASADVLTDAHFDDLASALDLVERGDDKNAERVLLRLGADILVERVDAMMTGMLGVSDAACTSDANSRSIFTGLGGPCALHLLVQAAYEPMADYFMNPGQSKANSSEVATTVYRNMLATPLVDNTPVIFNVGVGANYIRGEKDVWGNKGYAAMTVVDKIGLAFYKRNMQNFRWETGPFVGGFLDALVRTLEKNDAQRYWLAGYTAGFTRMWGTDLGVELHVAAAMPFEINDTHHYGLTLGGTLVVPFNSVLGGN
jgi:hypothetical protein